MQKNERLRYEDGGKSVYCARHSTDADNPVHLFVAVYGVMKKLSSPADDCHLCGGIRCWRLWCSDAQDCNSVCKILSISLDSNNSSSRDRAHPAARCADFPRSGQDRSLILCRSWNIFQDRKHLRYTPASS